MIFQHSKGSSGKTTMISSLHSFFKEIICQLSKNVVLYDKGNLNAEFNKLHNQRLCYIDEALNQTTEDINVKLRKFNLQNLLDLTGGGLRQERENFQKGSASRAFENLAKLILLGNDAQFNYDTHPALHRRVIWVPLTRSWRFESDPLYDANDPNMFLIDPLKIDKMKKNHDSILTWIISCMHSYAMNNEPLLGSIPIRFQQEWMNTGAFVLSGANFGIGKRNQQNSNQNSVRNSLDNDNDENVKKMMQDKDIIWDLFQDKCLKSDIGNVMYFDHAMMAMNIFLWENNISGIKFTKDELQKRFGTCFKRQYYSEKGRFIVDIVLNPIYQNLVRIDVPHNERISSIEYYRSLRNEEIHRIDDLDSDNDLYQCEYCDLQFIDGNQLNGHLSKHHKNPHEEHTHEMEVDK